MTDTNRTKYDPVALAGLFPPEPKAGGPRIEGGPRFPTGPMLSNPTETPEPAAAPTPAPPAPTWVMEALGKLVAPTRRKAAVLAAVAALGAGAYSAQLFTKSAPGSMSGDVAAANPMPAPTTPQGPVVTLEPNPLPTMNPLLENKRPTEAEMYASRSTPIPPVPLINENKPTNNTGSTAFNFPDIPLVTSTTQTTPPVPLTFPSSSVPDIRLVNDTVPPIVVPGLPSGTSGIGGGAFNNPPAPVTPITPPAASGIGGGFNLPAIEIPGSSPTPPAPAPVTVIPTPNAGSIGGALVPERPAPITPSIAPSQPPVPTITYAPSPAPTASIVPTSNTTPRPIETSFDVDVHTVRQGDTYVSISRKYYGEDTFANALQAYDASRTNRTDGQVHVPPVWVLRKRHMGNNTAAVEPVRRAETVPMERTASTVGQTWQPGTGRGKVFTPTRTMTMREIAKQAFGDEQKWTSVWDLNLNLSTDAIPAGSKVNLPADSQIGQ